MSILAFYNMRTSKEHMRARHPPFPTPPALIGYRLIAILPIGGILGQLCESRIKPRLDYARMENVPKRTKDGLL
jgi:hypothetical protein